MVDQLSNTEEYNYTHFKGGQADFIAFRTILPVGADAPNFTATAVDTGELVELKDYWKDSDLCVEFGSLT